MKVLPWPETRANYFRNHEIVFVGKFSSIKEVTVTDTGWPGSRRKRATFAVLERIKGQPEKLRYLETGLGGGDCSPEIYENEPFIIMTNASGVFATAWSIAFPPISAKDQEDLAALRQLARTPPNRTVETDARGSGARGSP